MFPRIVKILEDLLLALSNTMKDYALKQRQRHIEYSISLLEKAVGLVKVLGLANVPEGVKSVLDYALKRGDCAHEMIDRAQSRYTREYEKNPFEKLFLR